MESSDNRLCPRGANFSRCKSALLLRCSFRIVSPRMNAGAGSVEFTSVEKQRARRSRGLVDGSRAGEEGRCDVSPGVPGVGQQEDVAPVAYCGDEVRGQK